MSLSSLFSSCALRLMRSVNLYIHVNSSSSSSSNNNSNDTIFHSHNRELENLVQKCVGKPLTTKHIRTIKTVHEITEIK